jgi:hypothetical protein
MTVQHAGHSPAALDRLTAGGAQWRQCEIEQAAQRRMGGAAEAFERSGKSMDLWLAFPTGVVIGPSWRHMLPDMR